ncbi:MAG: hypothetical protein L6Q52_02015 [Rhodocyclaceae bacterium]|nr:hypothetical protein [Rhodocyclaceae bacterium]
MTQNGKARAVMLDVATYEETQEAMALLKIHALGIREYREIRFKPCRLIYRIMGKRVYIYLIADTRRDMQTLLGRQLLHS